ncbi:MAG: cupin [Chloroflexota bacterium]
MSTRGPAPSVDDLVARLAADGLTAHAWGNGPGDRYAPHEHGYDKVLVAAEGSIVFTLPATGDSIRLAAGDRLDLPAGTLHGALVGPDGVTCLEAHVARGTLRGAPAHHPGWGIAAPPAPAETGRGRTA